MLGVRWTDQTKVILHYHHAFDRTTLHAFRIHVRRLYNISHSDVDLGRFQWF